MSFRFRDFPLWAPLAGAVSGLALMVLPWLAFGAWAGWRSAENSGQIGWAVLTVPLGPISVLPVVLAILPTAAGIALLWAILMLIANLVFRPNDRVPIGIAQGLACGVIPAFVVVARTAGTGGEWLEGRLNFDLPPLLAQPALPLAVLCLIGAGFAGMTVAGIVAVRRPRA